MLYRHAQIARLLATLVLLTSVSMGCSSTTKPDDKPVEGPDYSKDAVLRLGQNISSRADAVIVLRSIEDLVGQTHHVVDTAKAATGSDKPTARLTVFAQHFGIDFGDLESWKKTGLRTDTPVFLAFGNDPVLVAELADEKRFSKYVQGMYETDDQAKRGFGEDSWMVEDGVAFVALDDRDALSAVAHREDAFSAGSLTEDDHFRTFREQTLGDYLLGMYVPRGSEFMGEAISEIVREFSGRYRGPLAKHILWSAFGHVEGFGMAAGVEAGSVRAKAWLGLSEEARRQASAFLESPRDHQWDRLLLEDAMLMWSASADPKLGWDWIAYALNSKVRNNAREEFDELRTEKKIDFDIERDLVDHLSGHSALMVYPLDKQAPRYAPMSTNGLGMIFFFTFTDPVVPKHLAQLMQDAAAHQRHNQIVVRLADGQSAGGTVQVVDMGHPRAPKFYVDGTLVAMASSSFDEATMVELFNSTDRSKRLVNSEEHPLAKEMFSSVEENVLYLNGAPFFAKLRERRPDDIGPWADLLEEALVTARVTNTGLVAEGELRSAAALGFAPYAFNREIIKDEVRSARYRLRKISRDASSYYTGRQNTCSDMDSCTEPWHRGMPGRFVNDIDQKVFPGGVNQEWHSHPQVPQAARDARLAPTARQHADQTMKMLGLNEEISSPFRFTYITNGVVGPGAQVIVRAEADFDPTSPELHTLEQTLTVGENGRVSFSQVVETNAFE